MANVYDEMINEYNTQRQNTQKQMENLAVEKQNALDTYEKNYNEQLNNYNDLMVQQQQNIDTWANTQKETQQKQTDYELGLIEQNKKDAEKQTNIERGNAYIDYQKGLNQFGGSAETLASQGLTGTGFAKNQDIAMNITYQNRLAAANSALQKANTDYDNQIQQALLTNDANLAEIALQQMTKSYELALQGFEYTTTMQNNRLSYIQNLNDSYFNKENTLQSRMDTYISNINSAKAAKEQAAQQAASVRYVSSGGGSNKKANSNNTNNNSKEYSNQNYSAEAINSVAYTAALKGGYKKGTSKVKSIYGKGNVDSAGRSIDDSYIYTNGNSYYVFDTGTMSFVKIGDTPKNTAFGLAASLKK